MAFNGHFGKNCFHPLFAFTSDGNCLRAKLRPGNVHSADGVVDFLDPIVKRYRSRFILFWLRGDAAFAQPEVYEYCEGERVTYFIRLPANAVLKRLIDPYLTRPVGRPPKSGIQIRLVDFRYQAQTWDKERRVIAKIEWHDGELFPRIGFVVTNSKLSAGKVVKVYNGRGDIENRIKEGKTRCVGTRRAAIDSPPTRHGCSWESWPKTSCTCSDNSILWAKRSNVQWNGSSSV